MEKILNTKNGMLINSIETNLDEKRSIKWGMIFAY
jgi:hypothetical protein